ncbi:MAG: class I SAM-dependent methyltransferase [Calditrichaeota bacterium]|nr:class I SAM-dependent methyltransferase [Calditrichota bacterium]
MENTQYIPALRYRWLTHLYDPIVGLTIREKRFKKQLLDQAHIAINDRILDVGSGTGTLAIWASEKVPGAKVFGLDADRDILTIARRKSRQRAVPILFVQAFSFPMPFKSNQFDRCLSSLFFHHLTREDKEKTFREIFRVLKPGGELHVADWGKPVNFLMRLLFYSIQLLDGFKTTGDNVKGMLPELMKAVGFQNVVIVDEIPTIFGTMTLYKGKKPESFASVDEEAAYAQR